MIRNALFMLSLAISTLTTGCLDEDPQGPQKTSEDDSDFDESTDQEDDAPIGCRAQLQDSDDPECNPKP